MHESFKERSFCSFHGFMKIMIFNMKCSYMYSIESVHVKHGISNAKV